MLNSVAVAGILSRKIKTLWGLLGTCVLMLLAPQGYAAVVASNGGPRSMPSVLLV